MIQTGLRISEERNDYLEHRAEEIGVSKNSLINMLIELGLKIFDSDAEVTLHPKE